MKINKIKSLVIVILVLFVPAYASPQEQAALGLNADNVRYAAGLKKYQLAREPWLSEDTVNKRVDAQIKTIEEEPDSTDAKHYLRLIEDAFLSSEQRFDNSKNKLLRSVSSLSTNDKLKIRLLFLCKNYDLKITQKDLQIFIIREENVDLNAYKMQRCFIQSILLRCKNSEEMRDFYNKLSTSNARDLFFDLYTNTFYVYRKDSEYFKFYTAVLIDLLARPVKETGVEFDRHQDKFRMVLQDVRAVSCIGLLDIALGQSFDNPMINNKSRYAFVNNVLRIQKHNVSLDFAKRYIMKYSDDIDELTRLAKVMYYHWPGEEIDPIIERKIKQFMKPVEALRAVMPKD